MSEDQAIREIDQLLFLMRLWFLWVALAPMILLAVVNFVWYRLRKRLDGLLRAQQKTNGELSRVAWMQDRMLTQQCSAKPLEH